MNSIRLKILSKGQNVKKSSRPSCSKALLLPPWSLPLKCKHHSHQRRLVFIINTSCKARGGDLVVLCFNHFPTTN